MDFDKGDSFTAMQIDAMNKAFEESDKKNKEWKDGCSTFLFSATSALFDGWMLMFAVAVLGFPLGYWPCVLVAYATACILGTGTGAALKEFRRGNK